MAPDNTNLYPPTFSVGGASLKKNKSDSVLSTSRARQAVAMTTAPAGSLTEEDGACHSVPNSPKLKSPLHQKLSHSCDDLLNEPDTILAPEVPLSSQDEDPQPSITITTPGRTRGFVAPDEFYQDLEDSAEEEGESGSESEFELVERNRPAMNPMVDMLEGVVSRESEEEEGTKKSDDDSSASVGMSSSTSQGKFSRLKDRLRNPFSRSRSPQTEGEGDSPRKSPSPVPEERGGALQPAEEHGLQSKVAAVRQRFKVNSPNLWRKMRRTSPTPPSEEDLTLKQARKNSKSRIIYIS